MEVLSNTIGLFAGLGLYSLFMYYFILSQAPEKAETDKKIILLLTGLFLGPILYFHANAIQITVLVSVWLILVGYSFSNRSISKQTEKLLYVVAFIGYLLGMFVHS